MIPFPPPPSEITGSDGLCSPRQEIRKVYLQNRACIIPLSLPGSNIISPSRTLSKDTRQPTRVVPHMTSATPKHPTIAHCTLPIVHQTLMHVAAPEHVTHSRYCCESDAVSYRRRYYMKAKEGGNYRLGDSIAVAVGRSPKTGCLIHGAVHRIGHGSQTAIITEMYCQTNRNNTPGIRYIVRQISFRGSSQHF